MRIHSPPPLTFGQQIKSYPVYQLKQDPFFIFIQQGTTPSRVPNQPEDATGILATVHSNPYSISQEALNESYRPVSIYGESP